MFKKVLIANRGAIATRIERTLKKMGIPSVAVYTKADQDSLHVDEADEAVLIGDGPVKESYLKEELILRTAIETGADAIHPGYGFLSENADFARKCKEHGITFIGPLPEQMEIFGLKHLAREIAKKAGVPLLEGTGLIQNLEEALKEAAIIGYPIMLKSSAGGGGIGMRICEDEQKLINAFDAVKHLAKSNFKDDGVFLEKYIEKARHIEVQIFGSQLGKIVAIGERDCSVQRRNQKIMEETPAPELSDNVRFKMHQAAICLAKEVGYQSAGTVEFLYDTKTCEFYFLEVNTRLQVEHGVSEEVYYIDLVEWMVKEAAGELQVSEIQVNKPIGHSIQARIYAEDCLNNFIPSVGEIDQVELPAEARVETWVRDHIHVTPLYDPMIAKLIIHGTDREDALRKLEKAFSQTKFYGITTNIQYLQAFIKTPMYKDAHLYNHMLKGFEPECQALEVLDGGIQTTVQDYPGRVHFWDVGVPPCGPMDSLSFRMGNALLGNKENAPGLEMTLKGGTYRFRGKAWFCLTGADMKPALDGKKISLYQPIYAEAGQVLKLEEAKEGIRSYLLIAGGFDLPEVLGSASTFTLGGFGGKNLKTGDVLLFFPQTKPANSEYLEERYQPSISREWTIGVIPGPHCMEEFLQKDYLDQLVDSTWEVHFNSSRTGVRLIGPTPLWNREDGGEAGLHPSNIHDNAYAIGALDLTGDMPILLGPDGPSLGGFVCPVTTASSELWKIGQLHPGDKVSFQLLTLEEAEQLRKEQELFLNDLNINKRKNLNPGCLPKNKKEISQDYPILFHEEKDFPIPVRILCAGDENLLVEYGEMELDLRFRFRVHILMEAIKKNHSIPIMDLTPGIRSLQIHIDSRKITVKEACKKVIDIEKGLPLLESVQVPSRVVHLPISWDDPAAQLAIQRYQQNVRPDAPWCPSNLEFIRRMNGLDSIDEVYQILFDATYLVLGLGDVYLGAPVSTPIDPRHRLVTTKYNPARTWTPENAVGIGGAYLCVYGMEGPGGYQFVGRTVQMWNKIRSTNCFQEGTPWLLRFFDQIKFYPVEAEELLRLREDFIRGKFDVKIEETTFDLGDYLKELEEIKESAAEFKAKQQAAFQAERERWKELGLEEYVSEQIALNETTEELLEGMEAARCQVPGSVWKVLVEPDQIVKKGDELVIIESMKMEFAQYAPCDGTVDSIVVKPGDIVKAGQMIIKIAV